MPPTPSELVALDRRHVWRPFTNADDWERVSDPPVVVGAEGPFLLLADGRRIFDGVGSWWVSLLGHGHPTVRAAIERQLALFSHVTIAGLVHEPAATLAERLVALAPPGLTRVFYSDNGSTAVEVAVRAAFQFHQQTGQPERRSFITFAGAYHGDTLGALSLSGIGAFRDRFAPLCFEAIRVDAPTPSWHEGALDQLVETLAERGDSVAAVIIEPLVQGAAGMLMHPPEHLRAVRRACDDAGALLIADEVFVGFGRTGTLFACEQGPITPDLMCVSKGLTGGFMPLGATLASERIFDAFRGPGRTFYYGHSYSGNPLGCAAAHGVLDALRDERVLEGIPERAAVVDAALRRIDAIDGRLSTRRTGLIAAVQIGDDARYGAAAGWRVFDEALARGAYLRPLGNVVYLVPPLNIALPELAALLEIVEASIRAIDLDC